MRGQEGWERLEHPCKKKHQKRGSPTAERKKSGTTSGACCGSSSGSAVGVVAAVR